MTPLAFASVFLSYARDDSTIVDLVFHTLEGFGCDVFLDRETFSGRPRELWTKARDESIAKCNELIVLVTPRIFEQPEVPSNNGLREQIRDEIAVAKTLGKPIRAIIFDREAFDRLGETGSLTNKSEQATDLADEYRRGEQGLKSDTCRRKLWALAVPGLVEYVHQLKVDTTIWAKARIPQQRETLLPSETLAAWNDIESKPAVDASGFYVLTGPGGEGKTVLLCRRILENRGHAVRIPLEVLVNGPNAVARFLGAPDEKSIDEHIAIWRRTWHLSPAFYVDGLEQSISPERSSVVVDALKCLVDVAPVLATARPEIWTSQLQWIMLRSGTIDITGRASRCFFESHPELCGQASRLLTNALFIDFFMQRQGDFGDLTGITTAMFLQRYLLGYDRPHSVPSTYQRIPLSTDIYVALAKLQMKKRTYVVPVADLRQELIEQGFESSELHEAFNKCDHLALDKIENKVRLRHDLLDAANCARLLESMATGIMRWFDADLTPTDLQIADALVRYRADHWLVEPTADNEACFHEAFDCLLRMLDVKKASNYRAWCATWILEGLLRTDIDNIFLRAVIQTMNGDEISSVADSAGATILSDTANYSSCAGTPPRRTRVCVSSLASLWRVFEPDKAPLPEESIAALVKIVEETQFRFRAIEGLGKYRDPGVVQTLTKTAENILAQVARGDADADLKLLAPLAAGLARYAAESHGARDTLKAISECAAAGLRAVRLARTAIYKGPKPPQITDAEFVEGFTPEAPDRAGEPSDWQLVDEYAQKIIRETRNGRSFGDDVVLAMTRTLYHNQVAAAASVATALGQIGGATAVKGLITALSQRESAPPVWQAVRSSLSALGQGSNESAGQVARCLYAIEPGVMVRGETSREDVLRMVLDSVRDRSPVGSRCQGASAIGPISRFIEFGLPVDRADRPVKQRFLDISRIPNAEEVGPALEDKFRIAFDSAQNGGPRPRLVRTTWDVGRGFHLGLGRIPKTELMDLLLDTCLNPETQLSVMPGLAVVHVICLLTDGCVLATKRPTKSAYRPGHWSLSIEEQIQPADYHNGSDRVAMTAALRGIREELGITTDCECLYESLMFEHENLNGGIAVGVRLGVDLDAIRALRDGHAPPSHVHEVAEIAKVPVGEFDEIARLGSLHPTARLRLELLREAINPKFR